MEIWKPIPDFEDFYEVSNEGKVRRKSGRLLKSSLKKGGYLSVCLCVYSKRKYVDIHRLVAQSFCYKVDYQLYVNHKDGDKQNNNSKNLEWVTARDNMKHAIISGLRDDFGEKSVNSKLTEIQVREIREKYDTNRFTYKQLAVSYNISKGYIGLILNRRRWNHI